ncbi:MAG: hypothetical protein U5Q44_13440 [Dehalococcoidia bacterium]|nr:hypothetical protein [Dehalococcoidia bacterium]
MAADDLHLATFPDDIVAEKAIVRLTISNEPGELTKVLAYQRNVAFDQDTATWSDDRLDWTDWFRSALRLLRSPRT